MKARKLWWMLLVLVFALALTISCGDDDDDDDDDDEADDDDDSKTDPGSNEIDFDEALQEFCEDAVACNLYAFGEVGVDYCVSEFTATFEMLSCEPEVALGCYSDCLESTDCGASDSYDGCVAECLEAGNCGMFG